MPLTAVILMDKLRPRGDAVKNTLSFFLGVRGFRSTRTLPPEKHLFSPKGLLLTKTLTLPGAFVWFVGAQMRAGAAKTPPAKDRP